jgi:Cellulose binding domain/NPCBM-associated, NEW3 domain of alpha-galactosidase
MRTTGVLAVTLALAAVGSLGIPAAASAAPPPTYRPHTISEWANADGTNGFTTEIDFYNQATGAVTIPAPWTAVFTLPGDERITTLSSPAGRFTQTGQQVTVTVTDPDRPINAGGSTFLYLSGTWRTGDGSPSNVAVNGTVLASPQAPVTGTGTGVGVRLWDNTGTAYIGTTTGRNLPNPIPAGSARRYLVQVTNTGGAPESLNVYSAPAARSATGVFTWSPGVTSPVPSWTTSAPADAKNLPPGQSFTTTVTVAVPPGTPAGTYYGVVWANIVVSPVTGQITMGAQAGIREYLTVN